ncbi:sigma-70 family RNA polymerase sigma factor [Clostridium ihumii]|uniref:sigma-70 family RNA polymerase sigma factor n=1 Tax=Clostridium ihumii TaxID=1470356 RepID=UPI0005911C80|nr:sigma-70 family RNA polymerase sigma factor [Clostridium ihumii]
MENLNSLTNEAFNTSSDYLSLIENSILGSKDSFAELIFLNKEYLYKTAFLYVKTEVDALEIYSETVYKAYISIHKLKNPNFFKTWITKILINNAYSKLNNKNKFIDLDCIKNKFTKENTISIEDKLDLYNAIDNLKPKYKTAIILKYFQNLSIKEISLVMNCKENTVKSYIYRAKDMLLKYLKEGYDFNE